MTKYTFKIILILLSAYALTFGQNEQFSKSSSNTSKGQIEAAYPTHYAYTSTSKVNEYGELIISIREVSIGLGANTMLFASPWNGKIPGFTWGNSISDTRIGLKYQMNSNILLGGGLNLEGGESGLAFFLSTPIVESNNSQIVFSPSALIKFEKGWHGISFALAGSKKMSELFSFIGDFRFSNQFQTDAVDEKGEKTTESHGMLGLTGALRIVPPPIPMLYIDLGIDTQQYIYGNGGDECLGAYLDIGFGFSL